MRIPVLFEVAPLGAMRWLLGRESISNYDLLDSVHPGTGLLYIARMHNRCEWWLLLEVAHRLRLRGVLFRTDQPALLELVRKSGGTITHLEASGQARCFLGADAVAWITAKLQRILNERGPNHRRRARNGHSDAPRVDTAQTCLPG